MVQERFLVKSTGDNPDGVRHGLIKIIELLALFQSAVIVVPNLKNLKDTLLADVLGPELSKKLINERELLFPDGKQLLLCGQHTLKNYRRHDVYLDLWGSKYSIKDIEALPNCRAIVMVTWLPEDSVEWIREHQVVTIYDDSLPGKLLVSSGL